jgi:hypothetical protein
VPISGGDSAAMRRAATRLEVAADVIEQRVNAVDRVVDTTVWRGADADSFRSSHWPELRASLVMSCRTYRGISRRLRSEAADQDRVSND